LSRRLPASRPKDLVDDVETVLEASAELGRRVDWPSGALERVSAALRTALQAVLRGKGIPLGAEEFFADERLGLREDGKSQRRGFAE